MLSFLIQVLLELTFGCTLFFNVFVSKKVNTTLTIVSLLAFLVLNIIIHRYKRPNKRNIGETMFVVGGLSIILIGLFYLIGFKTGFSISYSSIFKKYITATTWLKVFGIVILSEILRYVIVSIDNRSKIKNFIIQAIMVINFVLIDITIATKTYDLGSFNQFYEFFALMVIQSLAKNVLLNYISKRNGFKPTILYRVIIDLYFYFLPLTPKLNIFIEAVILLVFPYIVYLMLKGINDIQKVGPAKTRTKENGIVSAVIAIVFAILVALVSREFEYCMIAIGSGSMTGTINKGDAIIYKKYNPEIDELNEGDILVFKMNNMTIVHRIIKVYSMDGKKVYQTKGDANESPDNWIVTQEQCVGVVKSRVLLIAWPSVLLNEWF